MDNLRQILSDYGDYTLSYMILPSDPHSRLFAGFLLTSLLVAFALYRRRAKGSGFLKFLFPKSVWSHPSAWMDVRYFFFHGLIAKFFLRSLGASMFLAGMYFGVGGGEHMHKLTAVPELGPLGLGIATVVASICILLLSDFLGFYLHYLQHKIPLLWQFHKVHHSGEVMHPLSNFREHPIDNLVYGFFINVCVGAMFGVGIGLLGYQPTTLEIAGVGLFGLLFNSAAYSLRHSHIWLKWPGVWSKVFGSPAHHQVHHSRHPDHLDKNFGFMFPIWDILFGTYEMPETNCDVEFGIVEDSSDLNSCVNLYLIPFRDAYRLYRPKDAAAAKVQKTV